MAKVKQKEETAENPLVPKIDNSTNPKAETVYIAWCNFTTIKEVDGVQGHYKMKENDTFTAREVPQIWIDQAVQAKHALRKEDKDKWTSKEMKRNGYSTGRD